MTEPDETFVPQARLLLNDFRERKTIRQRVYTIKLWLFWLVVKLKNFVWRKNEQIK